MKNNEKRFLLRLDQDLYDRLQTAADQEGRSVNAYIVGILNDPKRTQTFEQRQIMGRVLSGTELNDNGLVLIAGIYYRYLIDDNSHVESGAQYAVIESNGNILTLKKI